MTVEFEDLKKQLKKDKKHLEAELEQILADGSADERREGSPFGKREEEATETMELEKRLTLEKRVRVQLVEVEKALTKFENDTYGICENCGKPIDPARLEALPQAALCMDCKALQVKNANYRP